MISLLVTFSLFSRVVAQCSTTAVSRGDCVTAATLVVFTREGTVASPESTFVVSQGGCLITFTAIPSTGAVKRTDIFAAVKGIFDLKNPTCAGQLPWFTAGPSNPPNTPATISQPKQTFKLKISQTAANDPFFGPKVQLAKSICGPPLPSGVVNALDCTNAANKLDTNQQAAGQISSATGSCNIRVKSSNNANFDAGAAKPNLVATVNQIMKECKGQPGKIIVTKITEFLNARISIEVFSGTTTTLRRKN